MDQDPNSIEPTSEACLFSGLAFLVQCLRAGVGRRRRKVDVGFFGANVEIGIGWRL